MRNKIHRNRRKKRCGDKVRYLTREDAAHNMILLAEQRGVTGLSVYKCVDCKEFHVGHTPTRIRQLYDLE